MKPAKAMPGAVARDRQRWVTPEALNVAPQWVGAPLAKPARRALALGVDLIVVALLSGVSGLWLIGGLVLVALQLRARRGGGSGGRRAWVGWGVATVLVLLAAQEGLDRWDTRQGVDTQAATAEDRAEQAARVAEKAADALERAADGQHADPARRQVAPHETAGALAASAVPPASAASAPRISDAERIAQLEAELAEARKPHVVKWREEFDHLLNTLGAGLGWGIVYFSLLPAWWGGQTVGKKLFGLRVVELTGKPMTVMRCLKRYGGYAAGMATGGVGFAQVLWDANCQGLHDKAAHTVVLDLRAAPQVPAAAPPA
jgi:hypothetical protein